MDVIAEDGPPLPAPTVVTVGVYDGVHLGHRRTLERVVEAAHSARLESAVVTFDRHPASVLRPESAPALLATLEDRLGLLAAVGLDRAVVLRFDEVAAQEEPEDFVDRLLVRRLRAARVVVGTNFHFGHRRRGDVDLLRRLGAEVGFEVDGVDLAEVGEDVISSTRIRRLVADGAVAEAASLLGRPYVAVGRVVRGDGRGGRDLGWPTANLDVVSGLAVPKVGIYAGWYERPDGTLYRAAISVGRRPTFYETAAILIEAHLLDFSGDLYGEEARVAFAARQRDEVRFADTAALRRAIAEDVQVARRLLVEPPAGLRPSGRWVAAGPTALTKTADA